MRDQIWSIYHPILGFLSLHYRDAGIQSYNRHVNANDRAYGFRDKDKYKTEHFIYDVDVQQNWQFML